MQRGRIAITTCSLLFAVMFTACDSGDSSDGQKDKPDMNESMGGDDDGTDPDDGTGTPTDNPTNDPGDDDQDDDNQGDDDPGDDDNQGDDDPGDDDNQGDDDPGDDDTTTEPGDDDSGDDDTTTDPDEDDDSSTEPDDNKIDCSTLAPTGIGIGDVPENVELQVADGNTVALHDYCNEVIYAMSGTVYCSHCNEEARRAADLVSNTFTDGSVKVFFLLSADRDGNPATLDDVKAWDAKFGWAPHGMGLNDAQMTGFKTLWNRTGKDGAMVLKRGFVVTAIDPTDPKSAIEAALAASENE